MNFAPACLTLTLTHLTLAPVPAMRGLKEILRSRLGRFVPMERCNLIADRTAAVENIRYTAVSADDEAQKKVARDFMVSRFYVHAPIPKALQLSSDDDASREIVAKESALALNSGLCSTLHLEDTGELVGCMFNSCWRRDPEYDAVRGHSMLAWHNAAAEIAMEEAPKRPQPVWRDYQYQHLYNAAQLWLEQTDAEFLIYYGMGYLEPKARKLTAVKRMGTMFEPIIRANGGIGFALNTIEPLEPLTLSMYKNPVVMDEASYKDETLALPNGEKVFEHLEAFGRFLLVGSGS